MIKRILSVIVSLTLVLNFMLIPLYAEDSVVKEQPFTVDAKSAVLMEASSGKILFEQSADTPYPPASVTKIMTLLLVMEAIEAGRLSLDDMIRTSTNASSMGGSQIYLKEGEEMRAEDMIKSVVISSANDAAVALAEHICGSEEAFVRAMNEKAAELGMNNTVFENTNGLDDTAQNHVTSARDIAIMSRALIAHKKILEYSSIWMDTIRDGAFGLTNTNRLIRFYKGANGLKTGSTSKAGFCISATAERNGMTLIAVIMGSPTRDIRNEEATKLLNYGFNNFCVYTVEKKDLGEVKVLGGEKEYCGIYQEGFSTVIQLADKGNISIISEIPAEIIAPIKSGDVIGRILLKNGDEEIGSVNVVSKDDVKKINFADILKQLLKYFCLVK